MALRSLVHYTSYQHIHVFPSVLVSCPVYWKARFVTLGWRSCSILFSMSRGNTSIIRKTDEGKICSSKPHSHHDNTEFKFPVKAHPMRPILHLLRLILIGLLGSKDLLRGQSSSACFPPTNRPVERSKHFSAVFPAVTSCPNKIYKQELMGLTNSCPLCGD